MSTSRPFDNRVMTAPRMAKNYTPAGVTLYTDHQMPLTTIKSGTFVNKTHISSTFRCSGCVNGDSFDPTRQSTRDVIFSYAYSRTAVANPGRLEARLSDHTATGGGYASFRVVLADAKSSEYDKYAAMAGSEAIGWESEPAESVSLSTGNPDPTSVVSSTTQTPGGPVNQGSESEVPSGSGFSHRRLSPAGIVALAMLGLVYVAQAVLPV